MDQKSFILLEKLVIGKTLSVSELKEMRKLFNDKEHRNEIDCWIINNWKSAESDDVEISYSKLKEKIDNSENQKRSGRAIYQHVVGLAKYYQQIAAILFIPVIFGISLYLLYSPQNKENFYTAEAPLGQKAKVELPDGSSVWLNSGSNIRYSSDFNRKIREIELQGEAFFDVQKNTGKPFFVHTAFVDVEVTGTQFNVKAYRDEPVVETSLIKGHVNLFVKGHDQKYELTPGNVLVYANSSQAVSMNKLNEEAAIGWKENRLIFINDDFDKLAKKIEKWYNMEVVYNPADFKANKLTVKLFEGEQLSKLIEIIESAIGARCEIKGNKIYVTKNKNLMPMHDNL